MGPKNKIAFCQLGKYFLKTAKIDPSWLFARLTPNQHDLISECHIEFQKLINPGWQFENVKSFEK